MDKPTFTYHKKKLFDRLPLKTNDKTGDIIVDDMITKKPLLYVKYTTDEQNIIRNAGHEITENIHMIKKTFIAEIINCDIIK